MSQEPRIGVKKHKMGVGTLVFMIYCLCAAGAFGIEAMIPAAGPGLTIVMLIVIPFIWGLPMALAATELGAARPCEGGFYKWIQEALGEFWGFQAGWWKTIANFVDSSVYVILAGGYFGVMTGASKGVTYVFQVCIIAIVVIINLRGIKESGRFSTIIGWLVLAVFTLIAVVGFINFKDNPMIPFIPPGQGIAESIGGGIAIGIWVYSGYEAMSAIGGEVEDTRAIPKATILAVPLIAATYIIPTIAGLGSVGQWNLWSEGINGEVGYSTVLTTFLPGGIWIVIFGVIAILANLSIFNSWITAAPRVLYAMSEDNLFAKSIGKVSRKRGVPYIPILVMAAADLILCTFDFSVVLCIEVLLIIATQCLLFISMIVFRVKNPNMNRPIKVPGPRGFIYVFFSIPVLVGILAYLLNGSDYFLGGLIGLTTGPIAYFFCKRKWGGMTKIDSVKYPLNKVTKLNKGDLKNIALICAILCVLSTMGALFLPVYEASWGPEYYLEVYGVDCFQGLLIAIRWFAVGAAILTVIFFFVGRKVEGKNT